MVIIISFFIFVLRRGHGEGRGENGNTTQHIANILPILSKIIHFPMNISIFNVHVEIEYESR